MDSTVRSVALHNSFPELEPPEIYYKLQGHSSSVISHRFFLEIHCKSCFDLEMVGENGSTSYLFWVIMWIILKPKP